MKRLLFVAALVATAVLAVPAMASASSYTISKREAQADARDAAKALYGDSYGIHRVAARCRPQFVRFDPRYDYHRWVCGWAGFDYDEDLAMGRLRITGHSNDTYGYTVLAGIRWQ
jgi:hypothetical protein